MIGGKKSRREEMEGYGAGTGAGNMVKEMMRWDEKGEGCAMGNS